MAAAGELGRTLQLVNPKWTKRSYSLQEGGMELGRLDFTGSFGSLAEASIGGRRYTLKRTGFLHPRITVRRAELDQDIAGLAVEWGWGERKGVLEFMSGLSLVLLGPSLKQRRWAFMLDEREVVTFHRSSKTLGVSGTCSLREVPKGYDPLLICLIGWYFIILAVSEEDAGVVVVTMAGS
jgi:hypothetical protein